MLLVVILCHKSRLERQNRRYVMVNSAKIKGRLIELGLTQKEVSRKLGLAQPTFNQKLNNIRVFDLEEAEKLQEILNIPDEQFIDYFFMKSVA